MHRTIAASLALTFAASVMGGSVFAQSDAPPSPAPTQVPAASDAPEPAQASLAFADPKWRKITPDKRPPAREDHTWTVDGDGRFAYLFGGRDGDREFGDLWRYDLERDKWKKLAPGGKRPQPRFGHSAVWVDGRGVVVFAGQRGPDFFDDLWAFDPGAGKWRKLPAGGSAPKRRYGSCMVLGPDGRLWISHGFTSAGRFDDTRAYNLRTERWAALTPDGRVPGERCLHECFTSAAGELVLYGGQDDGAFALGDLWTMSREREWQRLDDPRPKPRRLYAVTEAGEQAYIFGGAGEDNSTFSDLWRVDRDSLEFERVRVDGSHPAARYAGTLITDVERGRLLLFGGQDSSAKSDMWELVERTEPEGPIADDGSDEGITDTPAASATLEPDPEPGEV